MINTLFGNRLRDLRENNNLTQQDVATALKCSSKIISNYERGTRTPDYDMLTQLCDYYNVTADYLLGRTTERKYYKNITIDSKTEKLLYYFLILPDKYKDDVIRYAKLNTLDL